MQDKDIESGAHGSSRCAASPRKRFKIRPVYLLVVERVMSFMTFNEIEEINKNIDKISKQRDDIVSQIYRTMLFLASLLILVFLIEINLVAIPNTVWGVKLTFDNAGASAQGQQDAVNNNDMFIFGFLLIGNIIALLFSSAMVKMFMLEYMLDTHSSLRVNGPSRYVANLTYRFYVFVFGLIAEQINAGVPKSVTSVSRLIHGVTVIVLPITFIFLYCSVLLRALFRFWTEVPSGIYLFGTNVEFWYFAILVFFNVLTLSFYAFAFFPCLTRTIPDDELGREIEKRASELWDEAGKPEGKFHEAELLAERQIKLRHHML